MSVETVQQNRTPDWPHSVSAAFRTNALLHSTQVTALAIVILYVSRSIGDLSTSLINPTVLVHCSVMVWIAYPLQTLFAVWSMSKAKGRIPLAAGAVLGCVVAAIPISILSPMINWILGVLPVSTGVVETRGEFVQYLQERYPAIISGYTVLGTIMWMSLSFRWWLRYVQDFDPRDDNVMEPAGEVEPKEMPANDTASTNTSYLIRKLPHAKRGRILALSAEQHYVRVYTTHGNDLVLTSFTEAVASLQDSEGIRIHRSHWVNKTAIRHIKAQGSRLFVELRDSLEFPVSRSFSGAVREKFPELIH